MLIVECPVDMREFAMDMAEKVRESLALKPKNDYTGLDVKHRWYCGFLGELIFKKLLDDNNKKYDYEIKTDGIADDGDFTLYIGGFPAKFDVKTACKHTHTRIMLPKAQFDSYHYDYYIGIRLNIPYGEVWGYCKKEDMKLKEEGFDDQKVPTMWNKLTSLKPAEHLMECLDEQESEGE